MCTLTILTIKQRRGGGMLHINQMHCIVNAYYNYVLQVKET